MVHEEWIRNVLKDRPDLTADQLQRTRNTMDRHFPDALVAGFEPLIEGLSPPDPSDRHILAAAISGKADVIITQNLKDFPQERLDPYKIEAQHPDQFALGLFNLYPGTVRDHRAALVRTPRSREEHLDAYERMGMIKLASELRIYADVL